MTKEHALVIVHSMATSLYLRHGEFCFPAKSTSDAEEALEIIETEIANNFNREEAEHAEAGKHIDPKG